ncbi:SnoaL-like protein [Shimia isoporae]|uniref:SnoaL-like protein n=1 Tax=Shimia isoporae TaxID=647720 RepID=A0A4R1N1Z4_9RHOB|nr:nuclear transport factor 2 family protein [Shimia isoporae]TCK99996.1 SnoaL-like protein [Shimia isoporae]
MRTAKKTVELWVQRFNDADVDGIAALYANDATNHQVTQEPVVGRDNIRRMFEIEFAATKMVCIVEAIHDAGDVAALEWSDPIGLRGCGFFTVVDGFITFQRGYWDKLSFLRLNGLPIE